MTERTEGSKGDFKIWKNPSSAGGTSRLYGRILSPKWPAFSLDTRIYGTWVSARRVHVFASRISPFYGFISRRGRSVEGP